MNKLTQDKSVSGPISTTALCCAAALALASAAGCLCPPCAAGPAVAATSSTGAAEPAAAASTPAASGTSEVIWDGDNVTKGMSWASCDKEAEGCKATFAPAPGEGADGSTGLKLHGEGPGWQGGGWNWFGWYPENAGTDISIYDTLTFKVKVTAPKDKSPTAGGISFAFGCSKDKKNSADASLGKYSANAADGQWHDVSIPLKDFFDGKGAECDARTAWEIRASSWSQAPVSYDIVLDNITVAKK